MIRQLYSAAYALALPFFFPGQYNKRPVEARKGWLRQKLGHFDFRTGKSPLLWVHAVSVGEALAAVTFINAFRERHPEYEVIVSTITDTGHKTASDLLKGKAGVIYLPFDLPIFIRRAIKALRPDIFVVMETEIWPNLFHCMKSEGVPLALLNGRISEGSFNSYRKLGRVLASVLSSVDILSMQNDIYVKRVIEMGAEPSKVHNTGSFKFDLKLERSVIEWTRGMKRPVLVAGSTHRGEEDLIVNVFKELLAKREVSLILVPRHPERSSEVEGVLKASGLSYVLRSTLQSAQAPDVNVILVDTVGELTSIYGEADLAVIGGSFIPHGGQNPLEPAYWGKPFICGPHMENFPYIEQFYDEGAALRAGRNNLEGVIEDILNSEEKRIDIGNRALKILRSNRGAVERALDLMDGLIGRKHESA